MKTTSTFLCILFLVIYLKSNAQDINIEKSFFDSNNFRVGAILGYDLSWAGSDGQSGLIQQNGNIDSDNISYSTSASQTFFLGMDLYSPTSTVGFITGVGLNLQKFELRDNSSIARDTLSTASLEIPVYLKLRLGSVRSRGQFWFAAGGGFSITTKAEATRVETSGSITQSKDIKDQFNSHPYISGILGYEFMLGSKKEEIYNRDALRLLIYAKANYDLGNRLNQDNIDSISTLGSYSNPSLEFLRISFGVKLLVRFKKARELIINTVNEAAKLRK